MSISIWWGCGGVHVRFRSSYLCIDVTSIPVQRPDAVLISHAHRDHYSPGVVSRLRCGVVCSGGTRDLLLREVSLGIGRWVRVEDGLRVDLGGVRVEGFSAGHVLGSLQFRIELPGTVIGYTGDFCTEGSLVECGCRFLDDVDVLVVESTYGREEFVFPPRDEVYREVAGVLEREVGRGRVVVLIGQLVGKCQELTALASRVARVPVVVSRGVYGVNEVYRCWGRDLGEYHVLGSEVSRELLKSGCALVVSLGEFRSWFRYGLRRFLRLSEVPVTVLCSGWVVSSYWSYVFRSRYLIDYLYPLSSHVDFRELLEYVECVRPRIVVTTRGFTREFARVVERRLGIRAVAIEDLGCGEVSVV